MSERFDKLTEDLAHTTSRRGVLKMFGAATAAAAAATVLKPFRAQGACASGQTPCGDTCCDAGVACLNAANGTCGCAAGTVKCGTQPSGQPSCCKGTCSDPATNCCCPSGQTPCGPACCASGVACIDKTKGTCGCPSGYTSCGTAANRTCCAAGKACGDASCQPVSSFTGTNRTTKTCGGSGTCSSCSLGTTNFCLGQSICGSNSIPPFGECPCAQNSAQTACFCYQDDSCVNRTPCPNGQSDCPSGQACVHTCCDETVGSPVCFAPCGTAPTTAVATPANAGARGRGSPG
jgi:hypothetical protein